MATSRVDLFNRSVILMDAVPITVPAVGVISSVITDAPSFEICTFQVRFVYGSGGTTLKVWLQTSFDKGLTWVDMACAAFTTASAIKMFSISAGPAGAYIPTDGAMADDNIHDGVIGNAFRIKHTVAGTYGGDSALSVFGTFRGGVY